VITALVQRYPIRGNVRNSGSLIASDFLDRREYADSARSTRERCSFPVIWWRILYYFCGNTSSSLSSSHASLTCDPDHIEYMPLDRGQRTARGKWLFRSALNHLLVRSAAPACLSTYCESPPRAGSQPLKLRVDIKIECTVRCRSSHRGQQ